MTDTNEDAPKDSMRLLIEALEDKYILLDSTSRALEANVPGLDPTVMTERAGRLTGLREQVAEAYTLADYPEELRRVTIQTSPFPG